MYLAKPYQIRHDRGVMKRPFALAATLAAVACAVAVGPASAAGGSLTASPHRLSCGPLPAPTHTACGEFKFTNTTSSTVEISGLSVAGDTNDFGVDVSDCLIGTLVPPGGVCTFPVDFHPLTTGRKTLKFTVSEDTFTTSTTVALSGRGT